MALRADFDAHILAFGGPGREAVAAAAGDVYFLVFGVDFRFHGFAALVFTLIVTGTTPDTPFSKNGKR